MSNNKLKFDGLEELRKELRALPDSLTYDASTIVLDCADSASREIKDAYPNVTGDLRDKVEVVQVQGSGKGFAGAVVVNSSKLANIFENGSQARHTAIGANRGSMPPGHVFIPRVIKWRRVMYERLKDMMRSHGLKVSGSA